MNKFRRTLAAAALAAAFSSPVLAADQKDALDSGLSSVMSRLRVVGDGSAQVSAAWSQYLSGDAKAVTTLVALAKGGNPVAQMYVGYMLDNGDGLKQDSKSAVAYFSAAAPKVALARYNLGLMTLLGRGVPKDEAAAMKLFEAAIADAGIEQATVRLAQHHLQAGRLDEAKKWADKGAGLGNAVAFHLVGRIAYMRREFVDARNWFERAAAGGDRNSPSYLATIYLSGQGIEPTRMVGTAWKIIDDVLAGRARGPEAATPAGLPSTLTEDELMRARGFARDWLKERGALQPVQYGKTVYQVRGWRR